MKQRNRLSALALCIALYTIAGFSACTKATVNFGEEVLTDDPNIVYIDTLAVNLATLQLDSFSTSGNGVFVVGSNTDDTFGTYTATAFIQVNIPSDNTLEDCTDCLLDSVSFITRFTGASYGDTTKAFTLNVHRLTQKMDPVYYPVGYNNSKFTYNEVPIGSVTFSQPKPSAQQQVSIRLDAATESEIYNMLLRGSDTVSVSDYFIAWFKGLALTGSAEGGRGVYYFGLSDTASKNVIRVYYRHNGGSPSSAYTDLSINQDEYTFNHFSYARTSSLLNAFTAGKREVQESTATGGLALLHTNGGIFPRITFPTLFSLKELYPFIKVVKAELEVNPPATSYGSESLYQLPLQMALYSTDENNTSSTPVYFNNTVQAGNLQIDYLYHKDTHYTYDVTEYVNAQLETGRYPGGALLLMSPDMTRENRLWLDATAGNSSVKLKLYVLGL